MKHWIVAVHGGAGFHSPASEKPVKRALKQACASSSRLLGNEDSSALRAVEDAIAVLEDDGCLNAGFGSNLTTDGEVECDASILDGTSESFGAVGAVRGIKNPIRLAKALLDHSSIQQPLGRVSPLLLVGRGAHFFAIEHGVTTVDPASLVSPEALKDWSKWKASFDSAAAVSNTYQSQSEFFRCDKDSTSTSETKLEDTVGAIALDLSGALAAGVSSGGLLLKYPGRIGEESLLAAVFGAGAYAVSPSDAPIGVTCSVSGTGEQIIRANLARSLVESLYVAPDNAHEILQQTLDGFCASCVRRGEDPSAGVLLLTKEHDEKTGSDSRCGALSLQPAWLSLTHLPLTPNRRQGY